MKHQERTNLNTLLHIPPDQSPQTLEIDQSNVMSMLHLPGEKYSLFLLTDLSYMLLGLFGLHRGNIFHQQLHELLLAGRWVYLGPADFGEPRSLSC